MKPPVRPTHPALRFPEHGPVESAVDWLLDPLNPKRVDEVIRLAIVTAAACSGDLGLGLAVAGAYVVLVAVTGRKARRWIATRRATARRCGDTGGPPGIQPCIRPRRHDGQHGYAGTFWGEPS